MIGSSLQDIVTNSEAPTSNGVQVVWVGACTLRTQTLKAEQYASKVAKATAADLNPRLATLLKEHKMKEVSRALSCFSVSLDEENVLEFVFKLPGSLNKAAMKAVDKMEMYKKYLETMQSCIEVDALEEKMKALLFFHTLVLGTSMDKMSFMTGLFKRIDTFDILSLLEVITLYFKLHLTGDYSKLHKKMPSVLPSFDFILRWTSLILDTSLAKIIGHKEEYEIALVQLKQLVEESIRKSEGENLLKVRLAAGINKTLSLPSVSQSDIILETIYL